MSAAASAEPPRLMAVHAHPDDESSKGGATMARYASEGIQVLVCTLTGGERGSILNPAMDRPEIIENMAEVRAQEMERARKILGVEQSFMGFVDSGMPEGYPPRPLPAGCFALQPLEVAAAPLVKAVRDFRPNVIVTYDEQGGYPHPDHIKAHEVSVEAFEAAGDPDRYCDCGEPWQPLKLYYHMSFHKERLEALHKEMIRRGLSSGYIEWIIGCEERHELHPVTTRVACGEFFETRDRALIAHASQIDPTGFWFTCPIEVQQAAWPTEDYYLVRSLVESDLPEDDLFAGAGEPARRQRRQLHPAQR